MGSIANLSARVVVSLVVFGAAAALSYGQGLIATNLDVIAAQGLPVPGIPGLSFAGPSAFGSAAINGQGNVIFKGVMTGVGVTPTNNEAIFIESSTSALAILLRTSDPVPGLPGLSFGSIPGLGAFGTSPRIASSGGILLTSSLAGPGVTAANDTGAFGGLPGSFDLLVREGDPAPGTLGAVIASDIRLLSGSNIGANRTGQIFLRCRTAGGDTVPSNNDALISGIPGALQLIRRKGDGGQGPWVQDLGTVNRINDAGQVLYDLRLSTTLGPNPATFDDDETLWVWTPGVGSALLVREGDAVPGMSGVTFGNPGASWELRTGLSAFTRSGETAFICSIAGSNVTNAVNDRVLAVGGTGGLTVLAQRGDPIDSSGATMELSHAYELGVNDNGDVVFATRLAGSSVTPSNDTAICTIANGLLRVIAREGDPAPGTVGAMYDELLGSPIHFNDRGQAVFQVGLVGGDVISTGIGNAYALYAFDPELGVSLLLRRGEILTLAPGLVEPVASFGASRLHSPDGGSAGFNHNGDLVINCTMMGGVRTILRTHVGSLHGRPQSLSQATGGTHTMTLNGGYSRAGQAFLLAGSFSGTAPGIPLGAFTIPLNPDAYFSLSIASPNLAPLAGNLGFLDNRGTAIVTVSVPPSVQGLAGLTFHHAFATVDSGGVVDLVSEASSLLITP